MHAFVTAVLPGIARFDALDAALLVFQDQALDLFMSFESCTGAWIRTGIWNREIPAVVPSLALLTRAL
jgi:hypothetical protein